MKTNTLINKKAIAGIAVLFLLFSINAKAQFWTESFNNGCASGCSAVGVNTGNGAWGETVTGLEGADPNPWYVSCAENGHTPGICGTVCAAASPTATLATLHVGAAVTGAGVGDMGAAYDAGGLCGIIACPQTDRRAESPLISTIGQTSITVAFNYIEFGDPGNDFCTVEYSINGGATWIPTPTQPAITTTCAGGQGLWDAFSCALPATCNNIANFKIGFHWINNDDGVGTDPSFAVDDITLTSITNTITTGAILGGPFCACANIFVPYTATGVFTAGNIFTAELSDFSGSFAAPTAIGTFASTGPVGNILCTIPCATPTGTLYRIRVVSSSPVCIGTDNGVDITINATVTPVATVAPSANPVCSGALVSFFAGAINGGTAPAYQWQVNGVNIGGATTGTYSTSTIANGDVVTVVLTSNAVCASPTTVTSAGVTMVVLTSVTPSLTINVTPPGTICPGTSVTFDTASTTNSGTAPTFQWEVNGVPVGGATSSSFTTTTLVNGDNVTCVMTSNANCVSPTTATSNTIAMVVAAAPASVSIVASPAGTICPGDNVTFTASPTNGGATPTYQWQLNGVNIGGATSFNYSSTTLVNGDNITCIMTSSLACATGSPATSNTITMVVSGVIVPSVTIAAVPAGPICAGANVTFTATPTNGGVAPTYQWQLNGVNIAGATSVTYSSTTLVNGSSITVVMTSSSSCAFPSTATSAPIVMTITPSVTPSVSITSTPASPICTGTSVTFTATPVNGGAGPTYQWQVNATNVAGATSSTFTTTTLTNGSSVTVIMTSNATCASPASVTSNALVFVVNAAPIVTVNSVSICSGATATLTAGGATSYTWSAGATSSGVNTATASPVTTTSYTVTGTAGGCTGTAVATVTVTLCTQPVANFTASDTVFCSSGCVNFTDLSTNNPTSWNWAFPGATPPTSTAQNPSGICYSTVGTYAVVLAAGNSTGIDTLIRSLYIQIVNPIPVIITGNTNVNACETTDLTAQPNGQTYSWGYIGAGVSMECSTCQTVTVSSAATAAIYVNYTDIHGCPDADTTTLNVTKLFTYFMPTGFSPNDDGNNDVLLVKGRGVSSIDLKVFDRNGSKVFESTDLDTGWDGNYHGLPMNNNVFVYDLQVIFCNGDIKKEHGAVTLVK